MDEDDDIIFLEHDSLEKYKGKMVYIIDEEEIEHLDMDHSHGTHEVLSSADVDARAYHEPMKTTKVIIGTKAEAKEVIIGDYWSESKVAKIIELLHDYEYSFPRGYHELKGVHISLGEMKIKLKEGVRPVRKWPYWMNPNLCEKLKEDIEKDLKSEIIRPLDES
ncbi:hypothetical protein KI387_043939 [Taxus chinensis]|uniref:Uncharacterized protein n=1 Tax=Taxus chinensis TaxID=29808 RepID=A0AA38LCP9_TAXCH|nr:hypothetical protein KI387_043939 [Taxus chinensis]